MSFDAEFRNQQFKSVGSRPLRPDGIDKVTGRARYGADFNMPGQLVGRVLRSPHAHARIVRIDTSRAEAVKGVKAVVTAAEVDRRAGGDGDQRFAHRVLVEVVEVVVAVVEGVAQGEQVGQQAVVIAQ